ncbi:MAG: kelch repeat-containing protein, partial [Nitrospinota bacterium]
MPTPRHSPMAGVINGKLYVAGGNVGAAGDTPVFESYDPQTDTWASLPPLPDTDFGNDGRYGGTAGVIDGKLYVVGGWRISPALPTGNLQIYDPSTNSWTQGPGIPTNSGRSGCSTGRVINRKLYVLTACNGFSGYHRFLHVYNPDTNSWAQLPDAPSVHADGAAGVINGKLYIAGGFNGSAASQQVDIYDPVANTWSTGPSMGTPRNAPGGAVLNNKFYVLGGHDGTSVLNTVEVYDPAINTWSSGDPMPTARFALAAEVIGSKFYAVGGHSATTASNVLDVYSEPTLELDTLSFMGGAGDQRGTGITVNTSGVFISGNNQPEIQQPSDTGFVAKFNNPPTSLPVWSKLWGFGNMFGMSSNNQSVFAQGWSHPFQGLTSDGVGGAEVKGFVARFNNDGSNGPGPGGSVNVATPNYFSYTGVEGHLGSTVVEENGSTFVYVSGFAQPCSHGANIVCKFDTSGNLIAKGTDTSVGLNFNVCFRPSIGGSSGQDVTVLNGSVYLGGSTGWHFEGDVNGRPVLWKYDTNLNLQIRLKDSSLAGVFLGVTNDGTSIYAVGNTYNGPGTEDFLIQKYDANNQKVWSVNFGGSDSDVLTDALIIANRLFAVGYTRSEGAGGMDMVIFEIDPVNGGIISKTLYGGSQNDKANEAATDGVHLFVVGESRSFASPSGNQVGENEAVLLKYSIGGTPPPDTTPPVINVPSDITVNTGAGVATAVVSYVTPTATDNAPGVV